MDRKTWRKFVAWSFIGPLIAFVAIVLIAGMFAWSNEGGFMGQVSSMLPYWPVILYLALTLLFFGISWKNIGQIQDGRFREQTSDGYGTVRVINAFAVLIIAVLIATGLAPQWSEQVISPKAGWLIVAGLALLITWLAALYQTDSNKWIWQAALPIVPMSALFMGTWNTLTPVLIGLIAFVAISAWTLVIGFLRWLGKRANR